MRGRRGKGVRSSGTLADHCLVTAMEYQTAWKPRENLKGAEDVLAAQRKKVLAGDLHL